MAVPCPHCKGGIITREDGHYHCLICARNFKLVPMRGENKRLELVNGSRINDLMTEGVSWRSGIAVLPGQRR